MHNLYAFIVFLFSISSLLGQNIAYTNGLWFTGKGFEKGNFYAINGKLSRKAPSTIEKTIDLADQFAVPCFADVNSRILSSTNSPAEVLQNYFKEGVYYVQIVENTKAERAIIERKWDRTNNPDIRFTNGAITCTYGEPFFWEESQAMNIRFMQLEKEKARIKQSRTLQGDSYWFFDKKEDVSKKWAAFMEQKPDAVVLYLLDVENNGGKEGFGVDGSTAKEVAKLAKKSKIRVFAKVQTVEDVKLALKLKVAGFLNMPGNDWNGLGKTTNFDIDAKTLKKIAKKGIFICPNVRKGRDAAMQTHAADGKGYDQDAMKNVQDFHRTTLTKMHNAGVKIAMGSDDIINTSQMELNYWMDLNVFSAVDLITILSKNSAQAIFPDRQIGELVEGADANFMVLPDDPTKQLIKLRKRSYFVRNGKIVEQF